ncbi:MAG: phospholipid scramblase family protein [Acidimicrobiia bacterium]|nr:phospholipid scramblase family protein [Acidimicrobiia bacterium]
MDESVPAPVSDQPAGSEAGSSWPASGEAEGAATGVRDQVRRAGAPDAGPGGGSLLTEPVLVVNQKVKLIELTNEYQVFDQQGNVLGSVAQVGQSALKKAARLLTSLDQFMTHTLEIRDAAGEPVLRLTRPRKIFKSSFVVDRADGTQVGTIRQKNVFGKIRFGFESGGREIGSLHAENWRAWDFHVKDAGDREVARITKTWEGLAKTIFTTADNYVVAFQERLEDPLLSMVVASALCIDTALKQDNRGFN